MSKAESLFFDKTFDNLKDSVVIVEAYLSCVEDTTTVDYNKGLGVVVDANKILTSASIVKNSLWCYCRGIGEGKEQRFPVKVIDHSFNFDLALLTFESPKRIFKVATIENSYGISYGESVLVIANPHDSDFTLSIGQVACPERYRVWLPIGFENLQKFHESLVAEESDFGISVIQLNNIHSLNYLKGGPVFNFRGNVIGILSYATIYDMAVHLDLIKIFLKWHGFSFAVTKKWNSSSEPPQLYVSFMEEYNGHHLNEQDKDAFFRKMHQSVVIVRCVSNDLITATGSGVLVGDGLILTAAHVVCGQSQFLVSFMDKSNWETELIFFDDYLDLALLRNKDGFEDHPRVTLAERSSVHHGAMALAIGHPSGFNFSFTIGTVVLPSYRTGNFVKEANFYWPVEKCYAVKPKELTSLLFATCNTHFQPGSSGCPVFNTRGQLIGISTHSQNPVDFMVHINDIHDFMEASKEIGMHGTEVEILDSTPLKRKIDESESKCGKKPRDLVLRVAAEQVKEVKVPLDHPILARKIQQQEAAAQEDVGVKVNKCIKIFLVSSKEEVGVEDSFRIVPIDLSHFFDEDGQVFGYKSLKINVFLSTISFHAYADITFESLCDGERGIVNLKSSLQKIFGESLVKEKDDFLKTFSAGTDYIRNVISNGEVLQREATKGDSNNKSHKQLEAENFTVEQQVIRMAVNSMAVGELYCRLIPLVLLLVDGSSPIDVTDPRWEIYLAVESISNDHGVVDINLLGFAAVNRFYDDTGNSRLRISQMLVLPPYQGRGHGRLLLEVINSVAVSENVYDVTVEKPSDYFQHVRTCFDMHRLLHFEPIKHDIRSAALHLNQGNSSKKPFKGQFDPPLTAVEDVRRSLKINKKQFLQCWEILLFLELIRSDSQYMENYRTLITDGRRDDVLGKNTALNDFDHEMTSIAVCPRDDVNVDNIIAEVEGNQDTQEEQLKQLVGNRLKEIMEIAMKILLNHQ